MRPRKALALLALAVALAVLSGCSQSGLEAELNESKVAVEKFEVTVRDLTRQLGELREENRKLTEEVKTQAEARKVLEEEIAVLKAKVEGLRERSEAVKAQPGTAPRAAASGKADRNAKSAHRGNIGDVRFYYTKLMALKHLQATGL